MLNKFKLDNSQIIKNRSDFSMIIRDGIVYTGKFFLIAVASNSNLRFGFTTKSGLRKVDRNRLKRRARELWRIHQGEYNLHGEFIIITRERALHVPFLLLENDFQNLLCKIEKSGRGCMTSN